MPQILQAYGRLAVPFTLAVRRRDDGDDATAGPFAVSWNCRGESCDACCASYRTSAWALGITGRVDGVKSLDVASMRVYRLSWSKGLSTVTFSSTQSRTAAMAARTTSGDSSIKIFGVCPGTKPSRSPNVDWGGVYGASVDCSFQISVPGQIERQHTRENSEKDSGDMESEEEVTGKSSSRIATKRCSGCGIAACLSTPGSKVDGVDEWGPAKYA